MLLCFDLKKAFNQISLSDMDANKLLCLWYRNVEKGDYTLVGFRNVRLSFGLRCSPTLLMLALFKILVLDGQDDGPDLQNLKRRIYQLSYMDNCAISANNAESLNWAYEELKGIFSPYKFDLQQFMTNNLKLQEKIDGTDIDPTPTEVKLLGMNWNRLEDLLYTRPICLNLQANTKRSILSTIASQYDIYNFNGPLLNRSRLFMHRLQCDKILGWDTVLTNKLRKEWRTIARQANAAPTLKVKRFVGNRSDAYRLIACSDASSEIYGATVYIQNLRTNEINFVMAKNRIVGKNLSKKSIPSLETQGMHLAAECLIDLHKELTSFSCIDPINIIDMHAYSDSLVSLCWLKSFCDTYEKMQKKAIFVQNRLHSIAKLCEHAPIQFSFVSGSENPADFITRCVSYNRLIKTNYLTGPDFLRNRENPMYSRADIIQVRVPNALANPNSCTQVTQAGVKSVPKLTSIFEVDKYSSFEKMVKVHRQVLIFINHLKRSIQVKYPDKYAHVTVRSEDHNFYAETVDNIIRSEQNLQFPEIYSYFASSNRTVKSMPNLVRQLNVYIDQNGILRVKSKMERSNETNVRYPVLLKSDSLLTSLIIQSQHEKLAHVGCYSLVSELRKQFWLPKFFQTVKKILKNCVICKRFSGRTIKLNQSPYREFRLNSSVRPYCNIAIDHLGPFTVKSSTNQNVKVWLLCITCMHTRAVNLKLCMNLSTDEFLRALQLHCFEYRTPSYCLSDMGSQLVCGANMLSDFLKDHETIAYFEQYGIKPFKYEQFVKGHSQLGSLVEVCVKMTKKLIFSAIKTNILSVRDFDFLIAQTIHLINRRPVAFKDTLRISSEECLPSPISPEMLIKGFSLPSLNLIPELQIAPEEDLNWEQNPINSIRGYYSKLNKVRKNLSSAYHEEYMKTLITQAVDRQDRYKPVSHKLIQKGDVVLIKEPYTKAINYPMAIVKETIINVGGEVTGAVLYKGKTKETIKRHSSNLIPLLTREEVTNHMEVENDEVIEDNLIETKSKRKAAVQATLKNKQILDYEDTI